MTRKTDAEYRLSGPELNFEVGYRAGLVAAAEMPIEQARARVVEAAKAWAQPWTNPDAARIGLPTTADALIDAVRWLERLEAEVQA